VSGRARKRGKWGSIDLWPLRFASPAENFVLVAA
jgi:hypothetical protein